MLVCTERARSWRKQRCNRNHQPKKASILINDAHIFDGISDELHTGNLLMVGTKTSCQHSGVVGTMSNRFTTGPKLIRASGFL